MQFRKCFEVILVFLNYHTSLAKMNFLTIFCFQTKFRTNKKEKKIHSLEKKENLLLYKPKIVGSFKSYVVKHHLLRSKESKLFFSMFKGYSLLFFSQASHQSLCIMFMVILCGADLKRIITITLNCRRPS